MIDYYYKSGEEYWFCEKCGYYYEKIIDQKYYKKTKEIKYIIKEGGGIGTYAVKSKGSIGSLHGSISNRRILIKQFNEKKDKIEACKITYQKNGKWVLHDLKNNRIMKISIMPSFRKSEVKK